MCGGGSLVSHPRSISCPLALHGCRLLALGLVRQRYICIDMSSSSTAAVPVFSSCGGECEIPDIHAGYGICSIYLEPFLSLPSYFLFVLQ